MASDLIPIIVAIVALVGTIANAAFTVWERSHAESQKRYHALADVVAKYRDPLHLAAEDLSFKLGNIIDNDFAWWMTEAAGRARQEYAMMHTSFLFGQLFCWLYILRRETQFLLPSTHYDAESRALRIVLNKIKQTLRTSKDNSPFAILTGEQEAIGELMMTRDVNFPESETKTGEGVTVVYSGGQCRCIGYASFVQRWKKDAEFRGWFKHIVTGLRVLTSATQAPPSSTRLPMMQFPPDERLRRLQHQLVDLIECLDPRGLHRVAKRVAIPARECICLACSGKREVSPPIYHEKKDLAYPRYRSPVVDTV